MDMFWTSITLPLCPAVFASMHTADVGDFTHNAAVEEVKIPESATIASVKRTSNGKALTKRRPRIIVTTDGEIDDGCSMVRFLLYANEWDNEAIVTSRSWPLTPGGWGLSSTIDDYMRFALMLQNEGELDGERILKPETVRLMATSQLSDDVKERSWLPRKGQVGFGIDFAVRVRPPASAVENKGVVDEFFWDGAASTMFWVDPKNDLTAVLFVQLRPFDKIGLRKSFRDAVYGPNAIESKSK